MTSLVAIALALVGLGVAAATVRAAAGRPLSWTSAVAVLVVALLGATGLVNAGETMRNLRDRHAEWDDVSPQDALERPFGAVDPGFVAFAKSHLPRGETFFLSRNAEGGVRLWLNYRLAPNLAEGRLEDADWLIYWREPDPFRTHGVALREVVAHLKWGPDVGLIRIRRED